VVDLRDAHLSKECEIVLDVLVIRDAAISEFEKVRVECFKRSSNFSVTSQSAYCRSMSVINA
jgi:hypothetical protein